MKNASLEFLGASVVVAILMSGIFLAPRAHAYAVGSTSQSTTGSSYDFGSSLENLLSPFTNFISSLESNNSTVVNSGSSATWPTLNITPVLGSSIENTISQWLSELDSWFYKETGVQLSGIFVALLDLISWVLGLAQQVVNWLLGLFH